MRSELATMQQSTSEVRVKLHITTHETNDVKNMWMCLNYDQKPTVSHVIEHVRKNFVSSNCAKKAEAKDEAGVKLYLDDFWLPPCENSRLIRENDCLKVEISLSDASRDFTASDEAQIAKKSNLAKTDCSKGAIEIDSSLLPAHASAASKHLAAAAASNDHYSSNYMNNYAAVDNKPASHKSFFSRAEQFAPTAQHKAAASSSSAFGEEEPYSYNGYNGYSYSNINPSNTEANYYNHYYDMTAAASAYHQKRQETAATGHHDPKYWSNFDYQPLNNDKKATKVQEANSNKSATKQPQQQPKKGSEAAKAQTGGDKANKSPAKDATASLNAAVKKNEKQSKQSTALSTDRRAHTKFSIGNYVNYLREIDSQQHKTDEAMKEEEEGDEEYEEEYEEERLTGEQMLNSANFKIGKQDAGKNKPLEQQKQQQQLTNRTTDEVDKIAAKINQTGMQKWKNTTKQPSNSQPKHIIFSTTSSSTDETTSSSSSDEDESGTAKQHASKPKQLTKSATLSAAKNFTNNLKDTVNNSAKNGQNKKSNNKNSNNNNGHGNNEASQKFVELSKEDQLNAASYNRSYFVQNTSSLIDFKKIFNQGKLNAPQAEEFADRPLRQEEEVEEEGELSSESTRRLSNNNKSKYTHKHEKNGKAAAMKKGDAADDDEAVVACGAKLPVDYEKMQPLVGAPRLNDKIAFKLLELSSDFTPEVSKYKTGTVLEFDAASNEVTLVLDGKYNAVLDKPNKFTVVMDETEEEQDEYENGEQEAQQEENQLRIDWRNLMEVKMVPSMSVISAAAPAVLVQASEQQQHEQKQQEQEQPQHHTLVELKTE